MIEYLTLALIFISHKIIGLQHQSFFHKQMLPYWQNNRVPMINLVSTNAFINTANTVGKFLKSQPEQETKLHCVP